MQKVEINGVEVEVYTAEEVTAREAAVKGEYEPKLTAAQQETQRLEGLLKDRAEEFKGFRKLSEDQVAKLGIAERTIYENGLALEKEREINATNAKTAKDSAIAAAVRSKVGKNEKLFEETMKMYQLVGLDDGTQEGIVRRANTAFGALATDQPDLLASAGFTIGGNFAPPDEGAGEKKTFADSEEGKAAAAKWGLLTEPPKKA